MKFLRCMCFLIICTTIGCNRNKEVIDIVNGWKNKRIELPSINLIRNVKDKNALGILSKKNKVLTLINGDCGSCIDDLQQWKSFMKEVDTSETSFIYIIYSNEKLHTFKFLDSTVIKLEYPYFQDDQKQYISNNKFIEDKRYQTFLLDEDNRVVLIGNPITNKKIKDLYIKELQKK